LKKEEDGGLLKSKGKVSNESFFIKTGNKATKVRGKVRIIDKLFNAIRVTIKDT